MHLRQVYLDNHASTPCDPRVVEAMLPFFVEHFGNPSSALHAPGRAAADAVAEAREQVASSIGGRASELVFTSGATESNNLAIRGYARASRSGPRKLVVSAVEHKSVLAAASSLSGEDFEMLVAPVDTAGLLDLGWLIDHVDNSTLLVSVQAANNEIGTLQPVGEIAQIVHRVGAAFHCDAAQALGRLPIDVRAWDVDMMSLSAHKAYGPKGIGALYVRGGARAAPLEPLTYGGGQESALRPGTLNVPGIVGFGLAAELAAHTSQPESMRIGALRDRLEALLCRSVPDAIVNGDRERRLCGNLSLTFPGADAEAVIANTPELAISTGSACSSGAIEPSHVLLAIGLTRERAFQTIRIGIGRFNMPEDVEYAAKRLAQAISGVQGVLAHEELSVS